MTIFVWCLAVVAAAPILWWLNHRYLTRHDRREQDERDWPVRSVRDGEVEAVVASVFAQKRFMGNALGAEFGGVTMHDPETCPGCIEVREAAARTKDETGCQGCGHAEHQPRQCRSVGLCRCGL